MVCKGPHCVTRNLQNAHNPNTCTRQFNVVAKFLHVLRHVSVGVRREEPLKALLISPHNGVYLFITFQKTNKLSHHWPFNLEVPS